jgi:hypothetical protein
MQREQPTGMAARAAAQGASVMAVVNGDFDLPPNYLGVSIGPSITSGRIWTAGARTQWPVLALLESGEPVIGVPKVAIELLAGGNSWNIAGFNKPPAELTGPVLYSSQFRSTIKLEKPARAVVIAKLSSDLPLRADSEISGTVVQILDSITEIEPKESLVLLEGQATSAGSASQSLKLGQQVRLKVGVTVDGHTGVSDAIGGHPIIVRDGRREIVGDPGDNLRKRHPRTAACYSDKEVIFTVVDGRQPQLSVGMTLDELGDLMVSLGCKVAMNTDGGGSSVMAIAPPPAGTGTDAAGKTTDLHIVNSPSDGKERGRGNAWIVVADPAAPSTSHAKQTSSAQ